MNNLELKKIRKELGLNQEKFGEMVGVTLRTVQNWELGVNKIPTMLVILLDHIQKPKPTELVQNESFLIEVLRSENQLLKENKKLLEEKIENILFKSDKKDFKSDKERTVKLTKQQ